MENSNYVRVQIQVRRTWYRGTYNKPSFVHLRIYFDVYKCTCTRTYVRARAQCRSLGARACYDCGQRSRNNTASIDTVIGATQAFPTGLRFRFPLIMQSVRDNAVTVRKKGRRSEEKKN